MRICFFLALAACGDADLDLQDPVAVGRAFLQQRGCADCHQAPDGTLSGQTTPRPGTHAYPKNLTPDHETGIGDWADLEIARAVRFGFDDDELPLCETMPRFDAMTDLEANAIVAYLRSLAPVKHAIPESECMPPDGGATD